MDRTTAHLGNIAFDLDPERALQHYEMGVAIGEMALPDPFGGVLDWGLVDNRPFLRSLHGMGLSLWRLGRFEEAEEVMLSLLWLNPSDQQGVRFELGPVRKRVTWHEAQDTFSPPRSGGAAGSEPDSDEVWRSAEAAPILSQLRALTRFLGDGRRLTGAGNLTLGDARSLTELAATGDSMEEQIGGRISRARSAAELPGLSRLLDCARASGMVRVQRGRLRATRRGRQLAAAGELAPFFDEIAGAVMAAGPLTVVFGGRRRYFSDALDEVLDGLAPRLLLEPHAAAGPVPIAAMEARAADTLLATFAVRGPDDERRMRIAASSGVRSIYALFRLLGVVRPDELPATGPPPPDPFEEMTGTVELTAAGWAWVGRRYGTAPVPPFRSPSAG